MSEKKLPNARAAYRDSIRGLSKLIDSKIRGAISLGNTRIILQRDNVPEYITSKLEKAGYKIKQARTKRDDKIVVVISWEIEEPATQVVGWEIADYLEGKAKYIKDE